jgi:AAA domain
MVDGPTFNEGEHYHRKIYEPNKLNGSGKNQDEAPELDPRAFARKLVYPNEFDQVLRLDWLVKGILAKGHTSYLIGPPGSGKSALLGSVAVHLAAQRDWHGFKIRKKYATVKFAMERADLVEKRIWSECQRDGLGEVPIAVAPGMINLMDRKCVTEIIGTILTAEDKFGIEVGLATFDTFNKGIAAGGGEENSAKDQNIAWGNLRLVHEALARYHTIHIGAAGHTGKDESRGARGSNASYGDNDVSLQIGIGDTGIKEVSINKANELPEGPLMRFKMEPFNTGLVDQDGDPIEVWIAGKDIIGPKSHDADPKLTKNQQTMYSILRDAEQAGLSTDEWSQRVRDAGIGTNRKADIYDARRVLKAKCLVREFNGRWNASI